MLVDVQIAAAFQIEREAAVPGDLLQHVIEEPQARGDAARALARQVQIDVDVGLLGLAMHLGAARLPEGDAGGDMRPGFVRVALQAHLEAPYPQVRGELHVGVAVADHVAAPLVDGLRGEEGLHHAEPGLAAAAVVALEMRADEHRLEPDSLRGEQLEDEPVDELEFLPRKGLGSEAVLIRHHDEGEARGLEREQGRHDSGMRRTFSRLSICSSAVSLSICSSAVSLVQGAVAIQEQYSSSAHVRPTQ